MNDSEGEIKNIVENAAKTYGAEIVDLKISAGQPKFIHGLVDFPEGGITLDVCTKINKKIVYDLGVSAEDYTVEINSPGMGRPLKEYKDFLRGKGRIVLLWLNQPVSGRSYLEGEVTGLNPEKLFLLFKNE